MSDETMVPTADEDEALAKPAALVTYVVQRQTGAIEASGFTAGGPKRKWEDIATVAVPPRTKRRTVIEKALAEAGIEPGEVMERLRALDVDSAEAHPFEPYQPGPEWRAA